MFNTVFWKSRCLLDNEEKYSTAGPATDDNLPVIRYITRESH